MMKPLFSKALLASCLLVISPFCPAKDVTVNEAALAAQAVPRPNYGSIVTNDKRNDVISKDFVGDTSDLSNLRDKHGMGDLFTPGSNKANGCLSKNDPECLAVQLVYQGGANKPELDESEKNEIMGDYEDTIGNADDIIGDADSIVSSETHCETVETVIPGVSQIEVCDEATGGVTTGTCSEGWTMEMGTRELYRCHTGFISSEQTCSIEREVQSHVENRYSCVKDDGETAQSSCTVPVTVDVKKTYPYTCRIETKPATTETCIKTLNVSVIRACSDDQDATVSLKDFKEVGYSASGSYLAANVGYACSEDMKVTVKFGPRTMGTFTEAPSSFTKTYRIEFICSIEIIQKDGHDYYEVTITNTDKGKGTKTVSVTLPIYKPYPQITDHWESVCR